MNSEWEEVSLGSLLDVKHGFAFKSEFFSESKTDYQLVTPGNFAIGGGFQLGKGKFYSGPVPPEYILREGQIVVTMTDLSKEADTLGYAAVIPKTEKTVWLHNQRVGLLIFKNEELLSPTFAHYLMRSHEYRNHVVAGATGSTVKHTAPSRICEYKFKLPKISEQRKIGEILSVLDHRITLLGKTNKTLEAIAQAIFKSWFIDFDPVRAKIEGRAPAGMDEETAALFPDGLVESELGLIPKGWPVISFRESIEVIGGGTPKTSVDEYWGGEIPWFSVVDAPNPTDIFVISTQKNITTAGLTGSSTKLLPEGTTIISARGTVGKIALTGCEMAMNQSCYGLRGKADDNYFTYFSTSRLVNQLKKNAHGSVFDTITQETFSGVHLSYPNPNVITLYERFVQPMMLKIKSNLYQQKILSEMRDALLPRLISGKLRITYEELETQK